MAHQRRNPGNEVEKVGSGDFRQIFAELAYQMLLSMSRRKRMQSRATAALGVLKAFTLGLPGGITARVDVEASKGTADTGDPERDLATLLVEVGQVAQAGGTVAVFFLEEMQGLDKVALEAVCMAMNRVGQRSLPVALVGAGLPRCRACCARRSRTSSGCSPTTSSIASQTPRRASH